MNRYGRIALAAVVAAAGTVHAASAQLPGIPYGPINTGLGVNVAADYGKPTSGGGSAWGLTGGLGMSRFGVSASFGSQTAGGAGATSQTTFAGAAGLKLFGGGLSPVTIGAQVGVGRLSAPSPLSATTLVLPAAWVKVSPPLFPLKPYAQVYYVTGSCGSGCSVQKDTRVTIGANFNMLLGLGVHGAYDFGTASGAGKGWGVGAHFNFRMPMGM